MSTFVVSSAWPHDAAALAAESGLSFYDASWAAAARGLGIPLVSADQRLIAAGLAESPTTTATRLRLAAPYMGSIRHSDATTHHREPVPHGVIFGWRFTGRARTLQEEYARTSWDRFHTLQAGLARAPPGSLAGRRRGSPVTAADAANGPYLPGICVGR